jgi:hypothetical protein
VCFKQFQGSAQRVLPLIQADIKVNASYAQNVHLSVQLCKQADSFLNIAIRADAFDFDWHSLERDRYTFVSLRASQANANGAFHTPPLFFTEL